MLFTTSYNPFHKLMTINLKANCSVHINAFQEGIYAKGGFLSGYNFKLMVKFNLTHGQLHLYLKWLSVVSRL